MKISGVMLGTENSGRLAEFYTKVFGEPMFHQDDWYGYGSDAGSLMVGPHSEIHGQSKEPQRIMISLTVDDVAKEFDRLKTAGAAVIAEPYQPDAEHSPQMWLATVSDPDGNYMQLSRPWDTM